jgi:hypothetical protein
MLGPYQIVAPLGAGGMGEVYRAKDTRLGRDVAVKVLLAAPGGYPDDARARLRTRSKGDFRAQSSARLRTVRHRSHEDGIDYLVMELVEGETLTRTPGPRSDAVPRIWCAWPHRSPRRWTAAHRRGIIHRDLKPGNIMLTKQRGQADGLRTGPRRGARRRAGRPDERHDDVAEPDRAGCAGRHLPLHVARATRRQGSRRAQRPVGPRLRACTRWPPASGPSTGRARPA